MLTVAVPGQWWIEKSRQESLSFSEFGVFLGFDLARLQSLPTLAVSALSSVGLAGVARARRCSCSAITALATTVLVSGSEEERVAGVAVTRPLAV